MNKLTIIGRLTRDPELRTTTTGTTVCNFTVAVDRRKKIEGQPTADFFKVTAWRQLGENCNKWLIKGRQVAVTGPVSVRMYQTQSGEHRADLEVTADDVEFLSSASDAAREEKTETPKTDAATGFEQVEMPQDELPF